MAKYSRKIVEKICELVKSDSYTIPEICQQVGISESTFHEWKASKPEFSEALKIAEEEFLTLLAVEAKKSLLKKVRGYDVEETKTTYVDSGRKNNEGKSIPRVKEQIKITKHVQPDTVAIIFTLTNRFPDKWKNRQTSDVTGNIVVSQKPLSAEDRKRIERELESDY